MTPRDLDTVIREIVAFEVRYLRHYAGQVTNAQDPDNQGKVLVQIPMLGWKTDATAVWARPSARHDMVVPAVGEWVEVWFLEGNPNRAVYGGSASLITGAQVLPVPKAFDGKQTTTVIWQDPATGDSIVYDSSAKTFTMTFGKDSLVWDFGNRKLDINVNGNVLEMTSGKITLNGNFEVDQ